MMGYIFSIERKDVEHDEHERAAAFQDHSSRPTVSHPSRVYCTWYVIFYLHFPFTDFMFSVS